MARVANVGTKEAKQTIHELTTKVHDKCGNCPMKRIALFIGNGCLDKLSDSELLDYFESASWLWYGQYLEMLERLEPDSGIMLLQLLSPVAEFCGFVQTGENRKLAYIAGLQFVFRQYGKYRTQQVEKMGDVLWNNIRGTIDHQFLKTRQVKVDGSIRDPFHFGQHVRGYSSGAWVVT